MSTQSVHPALSYLEQILAPPENFAFEYSLQFVKEYSFDGYKIESYLQANGIRADGTITYQRVMMGIPDVRPEKCPAVVVPFYYPESAFGFDPEKGEEAVVTFGQPTAFELLKHGYIVVTADAYYINYIDRRFDTDGFEQWQAAADVFNADYPTWCGVGKLIADTRLLLDICDQDVRIDETRVGLAGHSLGGKMAFFTGCFDKRVKVILANDFGICWHNTNWEDPWYFGEKISKVTENGFTAAHILEAAGGIPFCLLAGDFDNDESRALLDTVEVYKDKPERLFFINHKTGHQPPKYVWEAGYSFVDRWLKD